MKKENELLITYEFDAPRELVFNTWTDPDHLKHWYAPEGCTIEFKSADIRPGGILHSCIHDPIHGECWIRGVYHEVIFPEKLVLTMMLSNANGDDVSANNAGKPEAWPEAIITMITFEDDGGKTRLTLHQTVDENEAKKTGAYQSWFSMFEKLSAIVTKK